MKAINIFSFVIIFILYAVDLSAEDKIETNPELHKMAWEMRRAVLNMDATYLMKYVAPSGTYFIDSAYSHEQIEKLIGDKNSWLYHHLFGNKDSVRNYFNQAHDLKIKVFPRNTDAIMVSYQSSNFEAVKWIENCFIKINGKWYMDGIFTCQ